MGKILWVIFFAGVFFSMLGFSVLRSFRDFFFGNPRRKQQSATQNRQNNNTRTSGNRQSPPKKKIIATDEGEYVDYEEVK